MSLGVDLMPHKTCTLDCVYCESGATTHLTLEPDEYVPMARVKAELREFLSGKPALDFITFSGSGDPTLHSGLGEIVGFIKTTYPQYKVAVLTNGTLLYRSHQRRQIRDVDVLKVSLDAATQDVFDRINRPCHGLKLGCIIDGLKALRKDFDHQFWVEVFLVPGINDTPKELEKIRRILVELDPHRVQLNTLDRPGTEPWVKALEREGLEAIAGYLLDAEIIKHDGRDQGRAKDGNDEGPAGAVGAGRRLLSTIKRRPCTPEDISRLLGLKLDDVYRCLEDFESKGAIVKKEMPRGTFYVPAT